MRTKWKKIGAAKAYRVHAVEHAAVALDHVPQSFPARSRIADITRPPAEANRLTVSAISAACQKLNRVIQNSGHRPGWPGHAADKTPSTVLEGDSLGAILFASKLAADVLQHVR